MMAAAATPKTMPPSGDDGCFCSTSSSTAPRLAMLSMQKRSRQQQTTTSYCPAPPLPEQTRGSGPASPARSACLGRATAEAWWWDLTKTTKEEWVSRPVQEVFSVFLSRERIESSTYSRLLPLPIGDTGPTTGQHLRNRLRHTKAADQRRRRCFFSIFRSPKTNCCLRRRGAASANSQEARSDECRCPRAAASREGE